MTNFQFCYWLQGYFEISKTKTLDKNKILLIAKWQQKISEPFGIFTEWLQEVLQFLKKQNYRKEWLDLYLPAIENNLNSIFFHEIDNSYTTTLSHEELLRIHNGTNDEK